MIDSVKAADRSSRIRTYDLERRLERLHVLELTEHMIRYLRDP